MWIAFVRKWRENQRKRLGLRYIHVHILLCTCIDKIPQLSFEGKFFFKLSIDSKSELRMHMAFS